MKLKSSNYSFFIVLMTGDTMERIKKNKQAKENVNEQIIKQRLHKQRNEHGKG